MGNHTSKTAIKGGNSTEKIIFRGVLAVFINVILYGFCVTYIYPFIWLIINSFKGRNQFIVDTFNFPNPPTLFSYKELFNSSSGIYSAFFNSFFNSVVSVVLIVVISFVVAYFLSRYTFPGRDFLYGFFLIGMLIPVYALMIPVYILFNRIGLLNTYFTLLAPYVTFGLPLVIFLYDSYMRTISRSIEEAAFVDGATINQIMLKVMFPICRPITGTVIIISLMGLWNEFSFALVLNSAAHFQTIPVWLTTFEGQYTSDINAQIAAMLIAMLPIIIVYLFLRDQMMEGLAAGAVKG